MNLPVTVGGLLLVAGLTVGVLLLSTGALGIMASLMSDGPDRSDTKVGCILGAIGMVVTLSCLVALIR